MNESLYEQYADLEQRKRNIRNLIDGALNRISTTDNENERKTTKYLYAYIDAYIELSANAHQIFKKIKIQEEE